MPGSPESKPRQRSSDDHTATQVITFLQAEGAGQYGHGATQSLLDHLVGTYEIVGRWAQPSWLQHAALIHSVYGTEAYRQRLIPLSRRPEVRALVGERAERLAHLFGGTPRRLVLSRSYRGAPGFLATPGELGGEASGTPQATGAELDALVILHLANLADQVRAPDGSPGTWLVHLRDMAEVVFDSDTVAPPLFVANLAGFSEADESACRSAYRDGLAQTDPAGRAQRLAMAAAACPVAAEPCVWLAYEARRRGELAAAREWAHRAKRRLLALGTTWDKRLSFDEWLTLIALLGGELGELGSTTATDPGTLSVQVACANRGQGAPADATIADGRPEAPAGTARFQRYMDRLADAPTPGRRLRYPDLDRRPWWEPVASALAVDLESHFPEIRHELLALDPARFAPESEPIPRQGDWDVVFLYERGRRHDDVCQACPATTRVIDGNGAMRTAAGLIYVSRMRPGTHIQAHRGPTNLRLRCHLGIAIPDGDCAIRVGDQSRRWSEGRCLVFDDSFEHEAWNHTTDDRIVLIVDIWHPGLSSAEVHLLTGLHRYASGYARRLDRYWAVNEAARRDERSAGRPPTP